MLNEVLSFWFEESGPTQWWKKDEVFDRTIETRFGALHSRAALGECASWRTSPQGRLAEVIVLDQFSRNLYRDTPEAFAYDGMALVLAQEAVRARDDLAIDPIRRAFLYMPYMHSESPQVHAEAQPLFQSLGNTNTLKFEVRHREIVDRFGRYPHRNAILGRESTLEELAFLRQPGSSF